MAVSPHVISAVMRQSVARVEKAEANFTLSGVTESCYF